MKPLVWGFFSFLVFNNWCGSDLRVGAKEKRKTEEIVKRSGVCVLCEDLVALLLTLRGAKNEGLDAMIASRKLKMEHTHSRLHSRRLVGDAEAAWPCEAVTNVN